MPITLNDRAAGVLLHPTSLPGVYPIGDLGPSARMFIDFLAAAGLRWWQMLPITPPGAGNSPYQSDSAFAGSPLLVSPDLLYQDGLIKKSALRKGQGGPARRVDFRRAAAFKRALLRQAFATLKSPSQRRAREAFKAFQQREAWWLDDYALFNALRFTQRHSDWTSWDPALRLRQPSALAQAARQLADERTFFAFEQWIFARQWSALRAYAAQRGVGFIGDMPIFVSPDSCDVWAHQALFDLRAGGSPRVVAGVPPDYFSKTGQRWGNPHYRWPAMKRQGYAWWTQRFRRNLQHFDAVRLDHFIGFIRYYEIPGAAPTAEHGRYRQGPGAGFFRAVLKKLKSKGSQAPLFIAEDLGTLTPAVKALRDAFGFPGMKVLQFAFGLDPEARNYQPHAYPCNAVAYTGTHDNDTTAGWFNDKASDASTRSPEDIARETAFTLRYLQSGRRGIHWAMIRAALGSPANTAIVPMQDFLGLPSWARMNRPGTAEGNWAWRMDGRALAPALSEKIRLLAETYAR